MDDFEKRCLKSFKEERKSWRDIPDESILESFNYAHYRLSFAWREFKQVWKESNMNRDLFIACCIVFGILIIFGG